jgi:heme/copper-type cytochrome/quinol oxidase subunit 2
MQQGPDQSKRNYLLLFSTQKYSPTKYTEIQRVYKVQLEVLTFFMYTTVQYKYSNDEAITGSPVAQHYKLEGVIYVGDLLPIYVMYCIQRQYCQEQHDRILHL